MLIAVKRQRGGPVQDQTRCIGRNRALIRWRARKGRKDPCGVLPIALVPVDVGPQPVGIPGVVVGQHRDRIGGAVEIHERTRTQLRPLAGQVGCQPGIDVDIERCDGRVGLVIHQPEQPQLRRGKRLLGSAQVILDLVLEEGCGPIEKIDRDETIDQLLDDRIVTIARGIKVAEDIVERERLDGRDVLRRLADAAGRVFATLDVRAVVGLLAAEARRLWGGKVALYGLRASGELVSTETPAVGRHIPDSFVYDALSSRKPVLNTDRTRLTLPIAGTSGRNEWVLDITNAEGTFGENDVFALELLRQIVVGQQRLCGGGDIAGRQNGVVVEDAHAFAEQLMAEGLNRIVVAAECCH